MAQASRLDRSPVAMWWWTIDRWFLAAFLSLMGLGIILSFAASPAVAHRIGLDPFHFATRQIVFTVLALGAMLAVSFLDARQIRRMAIIMLVVMLVAGVAFGVELPRNDLPVFEVNLVFLTSERLAFHVAMVDLDPML